jgi:hypothetical protein
VRKQGSAGIFFDNFACSYPHKIVFTTAEFGAMRHNPLRTNNKGCTFYFCSRHITRQGMEILSLELTSTRHQIRTSLVPDPLLSSTETIKFPGHRVNFHGPPIADIGMAPPNPRDMKLEEQECWCLVTTKIIQPI